MNKEDVKRLAREVADKNKEDPVNSYGDMITLTPEELMRFIDLIQAGEREACAKLIEDLSSNGLWDFAQAIRARGKVK